MPSAKPHFAASAVTPATTWPSRKLPQYIARSEAIWPPLRALTVAENALALAGPISALTQMLVREFAGSVRVSTVVEPSSR